MCAGYVPLHSENLPRATKTGSRANSLATPAWRYRQGSQTFGEKDKRFRVQSKRIVRSTRRVRSVVATRCHGLKKGLTCASSARPLKSFNFPVQTGTAGAGTPATRADPHNPSFSFIATRSIELRYFRAIGFPFHLPCGVLGLWNATRLQQESSWVRLTND